MTRTGALQGLQAKPLSNRWGITLQVCGDSVSFAAEYAHLEPTKGGLIDH
jgi:hypothetical protein